MKNSKLEFRNMCNTLKLILMFTLLLFLNNVVVSQTCTACMGYSHKAPDELVDVYIKFNSRDEAIHQTAARYGETIVYGGDVILTNNYSEQINTRGTIISDLSIGSVWSQNTIPYLFSSNLNPGEIALIESAIQTITNNTDLCLVEQTSEVNHIIFDNTSPGCFVFGVGDSGGQQTVNLGPGCWTIGVIIHEIFHKAGLFHEQCRSDQDDFITVNWDNILLGWQNQFQIVTNSENSGNYDFASIMHYPQFHSDLAVDVTQPLFTINPGVVVPTGVNIGNMPGMSAGDIDAINELYSCGVASCDDGIQNQGETGVDCGGTCTPCCLPPVVGEFNHNNIGANSVDLQYTGSPYTVEFRYQIAGTNNWISTPFTTDGEISLTNLIPNSGYDYQIKKYCHPVWSDWSISKSFTTTVAPSCAKPLVSETSRSNITSTTVKLKTTVSGILYSWRYRKKTETEWLAPIESTTNYKVLTGLLPSTEYQWEVSRKCANGSWSNFSYRKGFTTAAPPCPRPTKDETSRSNKTHNSIKLKTTATGTRYSWRYRKKTETEWSTPIESDTQFKTITGLSPSTVYQWQVNRKCANGSWSVFSILKVFTTAAPPCSRPTRDETSRTDLTHNSIKLKTTATGTRYSWRYRKATETEWSTPIESDTQFKTITGLSPSTVYQWQVNRKCTNGSWSAFSILKVFTTAAPPCNEPTITQNSTSNITTTSAKLKTSAPGSQFEWRYKVKFTSPWTNVGQTGSAHKIISELAVNTVYVWQVKRKCVSGNWSSWSENNQFTTEAPPCNEPIDTQNSTTNITTSSAQLKTTASGDRSRGRSNKKFTSLWINAGETALKNKVVSELLANTNYVWQVKKKCSSGLWSSWSESTTFRTNGASLVYDENASESRSFTADGNKNTNSKLETVVNIYPNPVDDELHIQIEGSDQFMGEYFYEIFSVEGQRLHSGRLNTATKTIDVSTLKAGFYGVLIRNYQDHFSSTFIKS